MALSIGELVGFIRADDSGWQNGLDRAALRLRGLQRDADGTLRDLRGRFVSEGDAAGRGLSDGIRAHADLAAQAIRRVGPAIAAVGAGVPALAGAVVAFASLASGAAAAGLAVKAFQLAAQPQLQAVTDVAELAAKAEEAAAKGGAEAAKAQQEYTDALNDLPPATRATAKEFVGLKKDYKTWSDEMSGTTMPLFTKGIQILRDLLPTLTPFVKAAAGAIGRFLDDVARGVKSAGFKQWAADMSAAAGPALYNFLTVIKNLAIGFAGLLQAFLPTSDGVEGGLVRMSEAFANWGQSLKDSDGFAAFMDTAREGAQLFGTLAGAALQVFVALSPLIGVTAQLATLLAGVINAIPPSVLSVIAVGITSIALGMKLWAMYGAIVTAVTRGWAIAQGILNTVMAMNPIALVVLAIAALVAIIVVAWQKSEAFRNVVMAVWGAIKSFISGAVSGIMAAIGWFSNIPEMVSGWFGAAKDWAVAKWNALLTWLKAFPGRAVGAISSLGGRLSSTASSAGSRMVSAITAKISSAISWIRGMPGRAVSALGNLGSKLYNGGRSLISGFINGIVSKAGDLYNKAKSLVGKVRNLFPFSPAREGPFSGRGYTTYSGRALIGDWAHGITQQQGAVTGAMARVAQAGQDALNGNAPALTVGQGGTAALTAPRAGTPGTQAGGAATSQQTPVVRVIVDASDGGDDLTRWLRKTVRVQGRGNVQVAFGGT
ncbi:hypothetical protein [Streptomyces coffeae]|uniref:Phage tail tape measure protein n=1 Tax=Streptomyces coffeae TaxID=621382 RepID=A0ABS1NJT8_9ACTN|nr:hypothetical protein [Streptomyces coffeae]MBL1100150.1 hypothetical protein [Streptomyces coffeae]